MSETTKKKSNENGARCLLSVTSAAEGKNRGSSEGDCVRMMRVRGSDFASEPPAFLSLSSFLFLFFALPLPLFFFPPATCHASSTAAGCSDAAPGPLLLSTSFSALALVSSVTSSRPALRSASSCTTHALHRACSFFLY